MTPKRPAPARIEFPNDLEIVLTREFDAPIQLVTKLTHTLAFRDQAGRDHMTGTDGLEANYDNVENLLRSLLDPKETVSG